MKWKIFLYVLLAVLFLLLMVMWSYYDFTPGPAPMCHAPAALTFEPEWARAPHGLGELQVGDVALRRGVAWVWQ